MEDIRAIYRIFNNLKYEMENNGWVYQWHLGDEPIKVTHKFNPPVTPEEFQLFEKYFPNMKLPASYKAFLSCSNGMELFCGEEGSSLVSCTIYSLKKRSKKRNLGIVRLFYLIRSLHIIFLFFAYRTSAI